jgi:hypothetical protein
LLRSAGAQSMNLADKFADELTKHDLLLRRYERGAIEQAMVGLRNLQGELVQAIKDYRPQRSDAHQRKAGAAGEAVAAGRSVNRQGIQCSV